jgi:hypothetical protein
MVRPPRTMWTEGSGLKVADNGEKRLDPRTLQPDVSALIFM